MSFISNSVALNASDFGYKGLVQIGSLSNVYVPRALFYYLTWCRTFFSPLACVWQITSEPNKKSKRSTKSERKSERERERVGTSHIFNFRLAAIWNWFDLRVSCFVYMLLKKRCECKVLQIVVKGNVITHFYYGIFLGGRMRLWRALVSKQIIKSLFAQHMEVRAIQENNDLCIQNDTQC